MGKAAKRERQKSNKALREEELAKTESRKKTIKAAKAIALILIVPVIITVAILVNKATDPDVYTAKITVAIDGKKSLPNKGVIDVEFDYAHAPDSVKHFIAFASNGYYDGLTWHRVVTDFVIQGGDPEGTGQGSLGSSVVAELPLKGYVTGDLAWAKAENEAAGTAGSQFFIVTGDEKSSGVKALNTKAPQADGKSTYQYGFIGHVTKGIAAALEIEKLAPPPADGSAGGDGVPTKKALIVKIEVFKNGKLVKRGDLVAPTTSSTSTTTTTAVTVPTS